MPRSKKCNWCGRVHVIKWKFSEHKEPGYHHSVDGRWHVAPEYYGTNRPQGYYVRDDVTKKKIDADTVRNAKCEAEGLLYAERNPPRGEVFVLRNGNDEEWKVRWDQRVCSPSWGTRGPAEAYLIGLQQGNRKPEYKA